MAFSAMQVCPLCLCLCPLTTYDGEDARGGGRAGGQGPAQIHPAAAQAHSAADANNERELHTSALCNRDDSKTQKSCAR